MLDFFGTMTDRGLVSHTYKLSLFTYQTLNAMDRGGGGQVVIEDAFYSDDPSSNPTDANSFSVNFVFENNKNKQKRPGLAHLKTKHKKP